MSQLEGNTSHINNRLRAHNIGVVMSMSIFHYSESYGEKLFGVQAVHVMRQLINTHMLHCQFHILL